MRSNYATFYKNGLWTIFREDDIENKTALKLMVEFLKIMTKIYAI